MSVKIRGVWKFNDTIPMTGWAASADSTKEYVNFTTYKNASNPEYGYIGFNLQHYNSYHDLQFLKTSTSADMSYIWGKPSTATFDYGWQHENRRTIDFGTTWQTVSDAFFNWFITCAVCVSDPPKPLSGVWLFNKTISVQPFDACNISFRSNGIQYSKFYSTHLASGGKIGFQYRDPHVDAYLHDDYRDLSKGWQNEAYRTVDFGAFGQTVDDPAYYWFVANATFQRESGISVLLPAAQFSGLMAGQQMAGQRRYKTPDISDVLVNISMDSGKNLAGDAAYNASVSNGGAFADGKFVVDGSGALTIPADFMAGTEPWTVAFTIDSYVLNSAKTYCRVARGNQDVPSIFYMTSRGKHHAKLATKTINTSNVAWYDPAFFTVYPSSGALEFDIDSSQATTFVFRNEGIYISFWVNGVMVAKQAVSEYTTAYQASAFSIGDDAAVGSDMTSMACSMLKAWNRALTDREIKLL